MDQSVTFVLILITTNIGLVDSATEFNITRNIQDGKYSLFGRDIQVWEQRKNIYHQLFGNLKLFKEKFFVSKWRRLI